MVVTMETIKMCLLGYLVLIFVHLTLSHSPEGQTRTGDAPGLSENLAGSTEQVESCKKIDGKSLIILCGTHCEIDIRKELMDITQIDNGTWLESKEVFAKNPNRCNCCKTEMPFTEKTNSTALPTQTRRGFSPWGSSAFEDEPDKRVVQDDLYHFMILSRLYLFLFCLGLCFLLISWLCSCCRVHPPPGKKVVKTRPILISSCSSGDSVTSTMIVCESQVEPNKDNPPFIEDIVSKPLTTPDSHPSVQVTAL